MKPGDLVLIPVPQIAGGPPKLRPALVLSLLPGAFQNVLICGVSSRLDTTVEDWDEVLLRSDADFPASGLRHESTIRLSYLYAAARSELRGVIGAIAPDRLDRLLQRLARNLRS